MNVINIKALSVNAAFRGRRFKSKEYEAYEKELYYLLPKIKVPKKGIKVVLEFGIPKNMDIDSGIKQFLDVCQKKYDFNDKEILELHVGKTICKKGQEFIAFEITSL